eukprot:COSAG01_NODE_9697_length_2367_cov_1.794092_2_plen_371_part_00
MRTDDACTARVKAALVACLLEQPAVHLPVVTPGSWPPLPEEEHGAPAAAAAPPPEEEGDTKENEEHEGGPPLPAAAWEHPPPRGDAVSKAAVVAGGRRRNPWRALVPREQLERAVKTALPTRLWPAEASRQRTAWRALEGEVEVQHVDSQRRAREIRSLQRQLRSVVQAEAEAEERKAAAARAQAKADMVRGQLTLGVRSVGGGVHGGDDDDASVARADAESLADRRQRSSGAARSSAGAAALGPRLDRLQRRPKDMRGPTQEWGLALPDKTQRRALFQSLDRSGSGVGWLPPPPPPTLPMNTHARTLCTVHRSSLTLRGVWTQAVFHRQTLSAGWRMQCRGSDTAPLCVVRSRQQTWTRPVLSRGESSG